MTKTDTYKNIIGKVFDAWKDDYYTLDLDFDFDNGSVAVAYFCEDECQIYAYAYSSSEKLFKAIKWHIQKDIGNYDFNLTSKEKKLIFD